MIKGKIFLIEEDCFIINDKLVSFSLFKGQEILIQDDTNFFSYIKEVLFQGIGLIKLLFIIGKVDINTIKTTEVGLGFWNKESATLERE